MYCQIARQSLNFADSKDHYLIVLGYMVIIITKHVLYTIILHDKKNGSHHRRWRREGQGDHPPHFFGTLFARKDQDTLIEQSGSGYSNRAVTVFREAV